MTIRYLLDTNICIYIHRHKPPKVLARRARLERAGQPIGNNDLWIAAHAKARKLVLITNNRREFGRVAGLKVENWAD